MSSGEMAPNDSEFSELSDEELDEVAGGMSFSISGAQFSQTNFSFRQSRGAGCGSSETAIEAQDIKSAAFQITVIDATTEDIKLLGELFGDASAAIEGSE